VRAAGTYPVRSGARGECSGHEWRALYAYSSSSIINIKIYGARTHTRIHTHARTRMHAQEIKQLEVAIAKEQRDNAALVRSTIGGLSAQLDHKFKAIEELQVGEGLGLRVRGSSGTTGALG